LPAGVKNMDELAAGLDSGRIAKDAVPSADRAKAAVFSELRRARQRARVEAGQGRAAATRQATKISQFNQVADQFDDLVTGVLTGTYTANRLKNWAYRADGSFTPEMNRLLRTLGEDSATGPDAVKRLVRTLLTADDSVSPVSKRVLEQNEGRWANTVMRPVEQSLREIENVTAELTAAARAELDDDIADTLGKAADFINEFTEYTHLVGAEVDSLGRPIGGGARAAAYQSAEVKSKRESVKAAAAALETPTKAEKDLVKKIQDALAGTDVPPVTTRPEGFATASQLGLEGRLEGAVIDEYLGLMFENMVQTTRAIHTPWGMQQLQQSSREIVRWWKSAATVSKPSFHVRNMISGVANGLLIGVGPENYRRMALPLRTFRRLHADGVELNEIFSLMRREHGERIGDMFEAAWNNGVFQGFSRAEGLAFTGRLPSAGSKLAPWNPSNAFFRGGGKVMESMEDMLRMAAFDRHYHGKGTERLAAQMVIAVHFDYQHLTMLEKKFKKFAPFFVWTRRNLPLQLQMLLERPGMINMWNHLQRNLEEVGGGFNGLPLSQYASPLAAPIDHDPSNEGSPLWARMIWDPDLPVRILDEIPAFAVPNEDGLMPVQIGSLPDWINWSAQLLGPQFTLPLNVVRAEEFGDVEAPRGLHDIIYGIDGLVEAGGLDLPGVDTSSGAARIPRWLRSSIETAVPFMSEYRQFLGYTPMDPNRTAREGLAPDDQDTFIAAVLKGDFDGAASGLLSGRGPTAGTLRGLGVNYQTPNDTRGAAYEAQEIVRDIRGRVSRAASN
ncbi:MAG: hypothetical protein JSW51_02140, partial [Gemmatimonadota bacterium]